MRSSDNHRRSYVSHLFLLLLPSEVQRRKHLTISQVSAEATGTKTGRLDNLAEAFRATIDLTLAEAKAKAKEEGAAGN